MPQRRDVRIDVADLSLLAPDGEPTTLSSVAGVQLVVVWRHRHCLPCQQHLADVQAAHADPRVGLVAVGFSPAGRLAAIARHRSFKGLVLSDPDRALYRRLGFKRAPLWRIYSPGTLAFYGRALRAGKRLSRPEEDTRQLGGDAVMVDGVVVAVWPSRTPDDRPPPAEVLAAATAAADATPASRG